MAIVEDASHAHGAIWRGRKCGTLGDVAVFSLHNHKLAPAGEGGMLLTDQDKLYERATLLGDVVRVRELTTPAQRFAATGYGMKTRMAALSAAVGRVQLRHLDKRNARRNANVVYLSHQLEAMGLKTFLPPAHVDRVYFEFIVCVDAERIAVSVDQLVDALAAEGCQVRRARYPLVHQQPFFTEGYFAQVARLPADVPPPVYRAEDLPQTQRIASELIALPSFSQADQALLEQHVTAFAKVLGRGDTR